MWAMHLGNDRLDAQSYCGELNSRQVSLFWVPNDTVVLEQLSRELFGCGAVIPRAVGRQVFHLIIAIST